MLNNHPYNIIKRKNKKSSAKQNTVKGNWQKTHLLLFEDYSVDPGCSYIFSSFHNMNVEIIDEKGVVDS